MRAVSRAVGRREHACRAPERTRRRGAGQGYAVPAINVVDELSLRAIVDAAVELRSPLIVQTSVKTVKSVGRDVLKAMFDATVGPVPVPVTLHLDHCPDRAVISSCLAAGWNSVLFDASALPVEENQRQTVEVVAEARTYGAHVEGEIEGITGVEDGFQDAATSPRTCCPPPSRNSSCRRCSHRSMDSTVPGNCRTLRMSSVDASGDDPAERGPRVHVQWPDRQLKSRRRLRTAHEISPLSARPIFGEQRSTATVPATRFRGGRGPGRSTGSSAAGWRRRRRSCRPAPYHCWRSGSGSSW